MEGRCSLANMKIFRWSIPPNCASTPSHSSSRAWSMGYKSELIKGFFTCFTTSAPAYTTNPQNQTMRNIHTFNSKKLKYLLQKWNKVKNENEKRRQERLLWLFVQLWQGHWFYTHQECNHDSVESHFLEQISIYPMELQSISTFLTSKSWIHKFVISEYENIVIEKFFPYLE